MRFMAISVELARERTRLGCLSLEVDDLMHIQPGTADAERKTGKLQRQTA